MTVFPFLSHKDASGFPEPQTIPCELLHDNITCSISFSSHMTLARLLELVRRIEVRSSRLVKDTGVICPGFDSTGSRC